ncbi:MAG: alpha-L-fucosidase [Promethearchaeota archaeon]
MKYKPKKRSLKKHEVPDWFHDAKLGIFIHWGLYSVPAFAITGIDIKENVRKHGMEGQFRESCYAEWYQNSLRIKGSTTEKYHKEKYGENFSYEDFVPMFNDAIEQWNPEEMVDLFKTIGAKYVVLVTKHHDGFLLWPSKYPNPKKENYTANRNIVGELTEAVKKVGLKMGFYYSGTFDWSFNPNPIKDVMSFIQNGVTTSQYIEYVNHHWYELIDEYEPIILWNDIGYPPGTKINEIFAYYYNKIPDGLINDRWLQLPKWLRKILKLWPWKQIVIWAVNKAFLKGSARMPVNYHCDYLTPEYGVFKSISKKKWEQTRGIGKSFGYNQFETEEDHLSEEELIHEFVDLVSKNGNFLLNVGPKADGTIPEIQKKRLIWLGDWLKINGEAIFGTRPWSRAEAITIDDLQVRFTQRNEFLYAILLGKSVDQKIIIKNLKICPYADIYLLGYEKKLLWEQKGKDLLIKFPEQLADSSAYCLRINPKLKN